MSQVRITGSGPLSQCTVELDGREIEAAGVEVRLEGGSLPQVVVRPNVLDIDVHVEGGVRVDENTRLTLLALGWTPPEETV